MNRRTALLAAAALPVAAFTLEGCAGNAIATGVAKVTATVVTDLSSATAIYQTLKGIGQVVLAGLAIANPALAAVINGAIAVADPILTRVVAAGAGTTTDVAALLTAATTINTAVKGTFTAVAGPA